MRTTIAIGLALMSLSCKPKASSRVKSLDEISGSQNREVCQGSYTDYTPASGAVSGPEALRNQAAIALTAIPTNLKKEFFEGSGGTIKIVPDTAGLCVSSAKNLPTIDACWNDKSGAPTIYLRADAAVVRDALVRSFGYWVSDGLIMDKTVQSLIPILGRSVLGDLARDNPGALQLFGPYFPENPKVLDPKLTETTRGYYLGRLTGLAAFARHRFYMTMMAETFHSRYCSAASRATLARTGRFRNAGVSFEAIEAYINTKLGGTTNKSLSLTGGCGRFVCPAAQIASPQTFNNLQRNSNLASYSPNVPSNLPTLVNNIRGPDGQNYASGYIRDGVVYATNGAGAGAAYRAVGRAGVNDRTPEPPLATPSTSTGAGTTRAPSSALPPVVTSPMPSVLTPAPLPSVVTPSVPAGSNIFDANFLSSLKQPDSATVTPSTPSTANPNRPGVPITPDATRADMLNQISNAQADLLRDPTNERARANLQSLSTQFNAANGDISRWQGNPYDELHNTLDSTRQRVELETLQGAALESPEGQARLAELQRQTEQIRSNFIGSDPPNWNLNSNATAPVGSADWNLPTDPWATVPVPQHPSTSTGSSDLNLPTDPWATVPVPQRPSTSTGSADLNLPTDPWATVPVPQQHSNSTDSLDWGMSPLSDPWKTVPVPQEPSAPAEFDEGWRN